MNIVERQNSPSAITSSNCFFFFASIQSCSTWPRESTIILIDKIVCRSNGVKSEGEKKSYKHQFSSVFVQSVIRPIDARLCASLPAFCCCFCVWLNGQSAYLHKCTRSLSCTHVSPSTIYCSMLVRIVSMCSIRWITVTGRIMAFI